MSDLKLQQLPPEMINDLAMAGKPAIETVEKYGFTADDYIVMSTQPWFHRAVEQAKKRLETEGFTFQNRMGTMAEDLLIDAYTLAKKLNSVEDKLDVAKYLSKLAGFEPKDGAAGSGGFSLIINVPQVGSTPAKTLTLDAADISEGLIDLDLPPSHVGILTRGLAIVNNQELSHGC